MARANLFSADIVGNPSHVSLPKITSPTMNITEYSTVSILAEISHAMLEAASVEPGNPDIYRSSLSPGKVRSAMPQIVRVRCISAGRRVVSNMPAAQNPLLHEE